MKGLFISGSGTSVGKTFIAQKLVTHLSRTQAIRVRKPVESDCVRIAGKLIPKDALLLSQACGEVESLDVVCRFRFEVCVSAEKASIDQGDALSLQQLQGACQTNNEADFVLVEGAGGLYSPIAANALNSDLAQALKLPLVLVVKDELGAINQALLCLRAAKQQRLVVAMLVLNQMMTNTLENAQAIQAYTNVPVLAFHQDNEKVFLAQAAQLIEQC